MCHYAKNINGFVMIIVLVFLQVFALLGLYSLHSAITLLSLNKNEWQQVQDKLLAEQIMQKIEADFCNQRCIFILPVSSNQLQAQPLSWWQGHACNGNVGEQQYFFIAEHIGRDDCSVIKNNKNQYVASNFYRITLLLPMSEMKFSSIMLQSTIAIASEGSPDCHGDLHEIPLGRQMRRMI